MDIRNPAQVKEPGSEGMMNRRDFLGGIAGTAIAISVIGAAAVTIDFLSPNVLFEPPTSFRIGPPEDFALDSVTYLAEQQVYVVRDPSGFSVVSAICTHLGCITQWDSNLSMIACPCHGSRFAKNGLVAHGPAPRPLQHYAIRLMPDGDLMVDKLEIIPQTQILKV